MIGIQCQLRRLSDVLFGRCVAGQGNVSLLVGSIATYLLHPSALFLFYFCIMLSGFRDVGLMMQCRWVDVVSAVARVYHAPLVVASAVACVPIGGVFYHSNQNVACEKGHIFYSKNNDLPS